MEKIHRYKLILGLIIMLAGMFSAAFLEVNASVSILLIVMGMVILVMTAFRLFSQGDLPDRDERTKKACSIRDYLFLAPYACADHGPLLG